MGDSPRTVVRLVRNTARNRLRVAAEAACQEIEQLFPDDPERTDDQCREPESEDGADGQDETQDGEEPPPQ